MAGTAVKMMPERGPEPQVGEDAAGIRIILADQQAIFRAGLRKIMALEDDLRVVSQAETLAQAQTAISKFTADVLLFESALSPEPADAVADFLRKAPGCRIVVVTDQPNQDQTLECFRRGAQVGREGAF